MICKSEKVALAKLWIFVVVGLFTLLPFFAFAQQVDTAWVRRYNGPGNGADQAAAIAVDDSGNVYATGSSFDSTTGYDYATVKYLPNGDTAWVRRYSGPANDTDLARDMVLDSSANVYITGRSSGDILTLKYDSNGNELWVQRFTTFVNFTETPISGGYALGLDKFGNLYVTGQEWDLESLSWFLIKYDSLGNQLWFRIVATGGRNGFDLALDSAGNVFIAAPDQIVKYDSLGDKLWSGSFPGAAQAITLDNESNVYVVGASDTNFTVIKYNTTGDQLWLRRSNSRSEEWQGVSFVAADKHNNVYVVGNYFSIPDAIAWTTIKYDSTGNQLWFQAYYGIAGGQGREPKAMALDSSGNVYVTGYDAWYAATLKYDSQGALLWEKKYGDIDHGAEMSAIALDQSGNVYVTGSTQSGFLTIKYAPLPELKGDLNRDGMLSLFDIVLALNCVFLGIAPSNVPPAACDLNCDGVLTAADIVILLNMTFLAAPPPC